jgi:hypothetical protein
MDYYVPGQKKSARRFFEAAIDRAGHFGAYLLNVKDWPKIPEEELAKMQPGGRVSLYSTDFNDHLSKKAFCIQTRYGLVTIYENGEDANFEQIYSAIVPDQIKQLINLGQVITPEEMMYLVGYLYDPGPGKGGLQESDSIAEHIEKSFPFHARTI